MDGTLLHTLVEASFAAAFEAHLEPRSWLTNTCGSPDWQACRSCPLGYAVEQNRDMLESSCVAGMLAGPDGHVTAAVGVQAMLLQQVKCCLAGEEMLHKHQLNHRKCGSLLAVGSKQVP